MPRLPLKEQTYHQLREASLTRSKQKIASGEYTDYRVALANQARAMFRDLHAAFSPFLQLQGTTNRKLKRVLSDLGVAHKAQILADHGIPITSWKLANRVRLAQKRTVKAEMNQFVRDERYEMAGKKRDELKELEKETKRLKAGAPYPFEKDANLIGRIVAFRIPRLDPAMMGTIRYFVERLSQEQVEQSHLWRGGIAGQLKYMVAEHKAEPDWLNLRQQAIEDIRAKVEAGEYDGKPVAPLAAAADQLKATCQRMAVILATQAPNATTSKKVRYGMEAFGHLLKATELNPEGALASAEMPRLIKIRIKTLKAMLAKAVAAEQSEPLEEQISTLTLILSATTKGAGYLAHYPFDTTRATHELHENFIRPHLSPEGHALLDKLILCRNHEIDERKEGSFAWHAQKELEKRRAQKSSQKGERDGPAD